MADTYDQGALIAELVRDEALKLTVYDDATGQPIVRGTLVKGSPTIGIGRNLAGTGISIAESYVLVGNDIARCEQILDGDMLWRGWWRKADPVRQRAILNMLFNMGQHSLDEFSSFARWCALGMWQPAGLSLSQTLWFKQVGARAARIQAMIMTAKVPTGEPAPVSIPDLPKT